MNFGLEQICILLLYNHHIYIYQYEDNLLHTTEWKTLVWCAAARRLSVRTELDSKTVAEI